MKVSRVALFCFFCAFSIKAFAWDGIKQGVPGTIEISQAGNYAFRVYVSGVPKICEASIAGFVYLEPGDDNYSTFVAAIFMAKAQGTSLAFYGNLEASGYCRLRHVAIP
jgi:hypothetical protein